MDSQCRSILSNPVTSPVERKSDGARLIKQTVAAAGLGREKLSGHSLRRGLLTAGAGNRAQLAEMRQLPHRSAQSVLGDLEPADRWRNDVIDAAFGRTGADAERLGAMTVRIQSPKI